MTAVAAGKDRVVDPQVDSEDTDFVAFSDSPQRHLKTWQVRPLPLWSSDDVYHGRRHAKLPKVLPQLVLPGYDFYIWIDANYTLKLNPRLICSTVLADPAADVAVFPHRLRNCLYQEALEVSRYRLDHAYLVRQQVSEYKRRGMPHNNGLFEMSAFVVRNTPTSLRMCLAWWEQICRFSSRDQLSFPYAVRATGATLAILTTMSVHKNAYFQKVQQHCYPHAIPPLRRRISQTLRSLAKRVIRRNRSNTT